jgi:hypothetical protein
MPRRKIEIDCGTRVSFAALFSGGQANGDQMVKEEEERKKKR